MATTTEHAHHWIVATPDGREMLPARCKVAGCKAQRTFAAYGYEDQISYQKDVRSKVWSKTAIGGAERYQPR